MASDRWICCWIPWKVNWIGRPQSSVGEWPLFMFRRFSEATKGWLRIRVKHIKMGVFSVRAQTHTPTKVFWMIWDRTQLTEMGENPLVVLVFPQWRVTRWFACICKEESNIDLFKSHRQSLKGNHMHPGMPCRMLSHVVKMWSRKEGTNHPFFPFFFLVSSWTVLGFHRVHIDVRLVKGKVLGL